MEFFEEWTNQLLDSLGENCDSCLFEGCANKHYQALNLDVVMDKYVGNLEGFIYFLEKEWGWKITFNKDHTKLYADENKDCCVCPIKEKLGDQPSKNLCNCSEKFAEKMFSKVCQKKVTSKVNRSIIRDNKSCIYEITLI